MASVEQSRQFFPEGVAAISDPEGTLYRAFGLERGSLAQLAGPRVVASAFRAFSRGHGIGRPVGDPRQMPGAFLLKGDEIVWRHAYRHAGERPDWNAARALAQ
ncbi:MAG: AhpC/TSA family protein [Planctomycetota bacterium]|jgi:hypothetical protein